MGQSWFDWSAMKMQMLMVLLSSVLMMAGARTLYYQQPVLLYPQWSLFRDCGLFGCIDDTANSVSGSIISGVNGTFIGIGDGLAGLTNGTFAIGAGLIQGTGSAIGGLASQGGTAIGGGPARALCFNGIYYVYC